MTAASAPPALTGLPTVVRLQDGKVFDGELPAERHRSLHLGLVHSLTGGYVELAAGLRPPGGKVAINTRDREDHYLPGGNAGVDSWLADLLQLADKHDERDEEVFIGVCGRDARKSHKQHVHSTQYLWVDVDSAEKLPALWEFISNGRTAHLVVESGGSGGAHAYWKLAEPLPALTVTTETGEVIRNPRRVEVALNDATPASAIATDVDAPAARRGFRHGYAHPETGAVLEGELTVVEWIERANQRLIYALGSEIDATGKQVPTVADPAVKDRGRVLRLAGTRNFKTGRHARIVYADLMLPGYRIADLVGDLADPQKKVLARRHTPNGGAGFTHDDPYKRIPLQDVYEALTGRYVPERGRVTCPHADHPDANPSCNVTDWEWHCYGCGAGGAIYDMASAVLGGPTGPGSLRGADFQRAVAKVREVFGER